MKSKVVAVIPARLHSSRFPGKVLHPHRGKPLLYYVWNQVRKARRIDRLIIATDSGEIASEARKFGAEVMLTARRHRSGTDRVGEVALETSGQLYINIQADNFGLKGEVLDRVIMQMLADRKIKFATLGRKSTSRDDLGNRSLVKVALGRDNSALWFSRLPIPCNANESRTAPEHNNPHYVHIGVYFFRRRALLDFCRWGASPLEKIESLEQLRILENHQQIRLFPTRIETVSVDTPEDMRKIKSLYG
ncbi:MAG: 3-deoxy-manno-octulosonate cytidylyltransferase [Candidatus Zixiibacteriota bacterium]